MRLRKLSQIDKLGFMDMRKYLNQATPEERQALAEAVGNSVKYFWQIAGGHRKPSTGLCKRLVQAEPKLTLAELLPEVWGDQVHKK